MLLIIERYLFYFFLFSIPFQIRKILYYSGWKFNEWTSISLYVTDILMVMLFCFWFFGCILQYFQIRNPKFEILNNIKYQISNIEIYEFFFLIFIAISAVSIKNSDNVFISWFQWLKLVEFTVFYFYLSRYVFGKFGLVGSFQAIIAIIQFVKQSSIGLKYLGESLINSDITGVASFYLPNGEKIIRSYGTTPHPNILAGFLFLSLFAFYFIYFYLHNKDRIFNKFWGIFMVISSTAILFAFFATFSRTVIFIFFTGFCIQLDVGLIKKNYRKYIAEKSSRKRITVILWSGLAVIILFNLIYFDAVLNRIRIDTDEQAVRLRYFYIEEALKTDLNLFGVGTGNFVGWLMAEEPFLLTYAYQPVHNIYLLIYSENGILGLLVFILFLTFLLSDFIRKTKLEKFSHLSILILFSSFLFIGFFDHFLWTLQQGRIIFWSSVGLLSYFSDCDVI